MENEHRIVQEVCTAQADAEAEERLIQKYLPFIRAEAAKNVHKAVSENDDEYSIAMFAFHEAVKSYRREKGAFLSYASVLIKNRIIDFYRKERRENGHYSLDEPQFDGESDATLLDRIDQGRDEIEAYGERLAVKEEILEFCGQLSEYGLTLNDIAENCPKQERTKSACHRALYYARKEAAVMDLFLKNHRVPLKQLSQGAGVERKTLERHRNYLAALLLAFTNGFEMIRGHLSQMMSKERRGGI